ncbi:MAG TPA: hypothetical protein VN794_02485 [Methylomirabilota bacterium]|nr:hypothetical protein [Methylomirabilota bacterium]
MTVVPVISRELRASARHPFTYNLRVLGVGALMLASVMFGLHGGFGTNLGGRLFSSLHFALFCAIWLLVPLLTADCISRERREGTLGLLFLTRLTGPAVVIAKGVAHGLRAATLWVAVIPVALIPIMQGGVSWDEALLSILINFSAICWALTAGLLASAWSKRWLRSLTLAALLSIAFVGLLAVGTGWVWTAVMTPGWMNGWESRSAYALAMGFGLLTDSAGAGNWVDWLRLVPTSKLLWSIGQVGLASALLLVVAVLIAGAKVRRSWQEHPPSPGQLWIERTFFTPVLWVSFFRRWMGRKLERNPIGWLEQRTWSGRLVTWGWLAVVISLYSGLLMDRRFFGAYSMMQRAMAWLLAVSVAMSAAGSFRRERETGVLELLLVSPLNERQIIMGRLRGLWGQFLPAFGLLIGLWIYFASLLSGESQAEAILLHIIVFLSLPIIGLYFSLSCRSFISAFLATLGLGLLAPVFLSDLIELFLRVAQPAGWLSRSALLEMVIAGLAWVALHSRLKHRRFPLVRPEH